VLAVLILGSAYPSFSWRSANTKQGWRDRRIGFWVLSVRLNCFEHDGARKGTRTADFGQGAWARSLLISNEFARGEDRCRAGVPKLAAESFGRLPNIRHEFLQFRAPNLDHFVKLTFATAPIP
jgi:hypothetical protein